MQIIHSGRDCLKAFAALLDRLIYSPARTTKLRLLEDYFRTVPDPDRGYALAALTGSLAWKLPVRPVLTELMAARTDPLLYRLSRDYVGDTAETVALLWPEPVGQVTQPRLADVCTALAGMQRGALAGALAGWLDQLDASGRFALLKLLTGAFRAGVSSRLAKTALASFGGRPIAEIEEIWHGLSAPYADLFAWLEGRSGRPDVTGALLFRPPMLAHPLGPDDLAALDLAAYAIEWKWDGIRVEIVSRGGATKLFTRTGDDISAGFPDLVSGFAFDAVLDGELLVVRDGEVQPFNDLQQRLNRKTISKQMLADYPAHIRLYDALLVDGDDLRAMPLVERRRHLEIWHARAGPPRTDLSEQLQFASRDDLLAAWKDTRGHGIEGMMLKRQQSPYIAGRPQGHWYKWKRAALTIDCVLMYAQRGAGRRSSYFSDYTFGAWRTSAEGTAELVPVGKAYFGFTDEELRAIDKFVRANTTERFGPVTSVKPGLVFEVAFDAVQASSRHKSGVALRFPRINRIRWDKPAAQADRLDTLLALIERK